MKTRICVILVLFGCFYVLRTPIISKNPKREFVIDTSGKKLEVVRRDNPRWDEITSGYAIKEAQAVQSVKEFIAETNREQSIQGVFIIGGRYFFTLDNSQMRVKLNGVFVDPTTAVVEVASFTETLPP